MGLYFPEGDPLVAKGSILPEDLEGLPLIASDQALETDELSAWFGESLARAKVVTTYTLGYNALVFVREGAGCMLGLDALAPTGPGTGLEFRPLWPPVVAHIDFAWRRGQKLSNAASMFLEDFKAAL